MGTALLILRWLGMRVMPAEQTQVGELRERAETAPALGAQHEGVVLQHLMALATHHEHRRVPDGPVILIADQRGDEAVPLLDQPLLSAQDTLRVVDDRLAS